MNKAAQLSKKLEQVGVAEGMKIIEKSNEEALYFDIIKNAMCMMVTRSWQRHSDQHF